MVELGVGSAFPGCEETNECYIPHEATIARGGTVTWVNEDAAHTVTAGDIAADLDAIGDSFPGGFDSGFLMAGDTFSHTFEEPGEYPYFCMMHVWMQGTVVVR